MWVTKVNNLREKLRQLEQISYASDRMIKSLDEIRKLVHATSYIPAEVLAPWTAFYTKRTQLCDDIALWLGGSIRHKSIFIYTQSLVEEVNLCMTCAHEFKLECLAAKAISASCQDYEKHLPASLLGIIKQHKVSSDYSDKSSM